MDLVVLARTLALVLWVPLQLRQHRELATTTAVTAGLEGLSRTMMMTMIVLAVPVVADTAPAIVVATATAIAVAAVLARTPVPGPWRLWVLALLPLLPVWLLPTRSTERRARTDAVARAIVVTVPARASQRS